MDPRKCNSAWPRRCNWWATRKINCYLCIWSCNSDCDKETDWDIQHLLYDCPLVDTKLYCLCHEYCFLRHRIHCEIITLLGDFCFDCFASHGSGRKWTQTGFAPAPIVGPPKNLILDRASSIPIRIQMVWIYFIICLCYNEWYFSSCRRSGSRISSNQRRRYARTIQKFR